MNDSSEEASKPVRRAAAPDPLIGRIISDRFRILSLIARGGMGKVYQAEQAPLGRAIALKVLNPNYQGDHDPEFHKRFFLEASICAKLTHPNTVTIFDYGRTEDEADPIYFIAMELLEGRTLHRAVREEQRLPVERALHIARQVCRSLREAHGMGVIHRDLKPANIFLVKHGDERDFVKVLDFGLVKDIDTGEDLTQTGLFMGSPKYMSPEQIRGDRVDGRSDVYALGVILFEMIAGKVPFDRATSVNILMAHVHEAPPTFADIDPDLHVDPHVEQIVQKAIAKDPDERYESMDAMLVALKRVAAAAGLAISRSGETRLSGEFATSGATGNFAVVTGEPLDPSAPPSMTPSDPFGPPVAQEAPLRGSLPRDTGRKRAYLAVAISLAIAAAVGGVLAASAEPEPEPEPVAEAASPALAERAEPEPPAAPTPAPEGETEAPTMVQEPEGPPRVMVTLRTEPPGAMARVGDQTYGPTPTTIEWTGAEARQGREVTFQFQLEGYRDFTVTRTVFGDELPISARLDPARPRRRAWMRSPMRRSGSGDSPSLMGYKAEPY